MNPIYTELFVLLFVDVNTYQVSFRRIDSDTFIITSTVNGLLTNDHPYDPMSIHAIAKKFNSGVLYNGVQYNSATARGYWKQLVAAGFTRTDTEKVGN